MLGSDYLGKGFLFRKGLEFVVFAKGKFTRAKAMADAKVSPMVQEASIQQTQVDQANARKRRNKKSSLPGVAEALKKYEVESVLCAPHRFQQCGA